MSNFSFLNLLKNASLVSALVLIPAMSFADSYCVPGFSPACEPAGEPVTYKLEQYTSSVHCNFESRSIEIQVKAAKPFVFEMAEIDQQCKEIFDSVPVRLAE